MKHIYESVKENLKYQIYWNTQYMNNEEKAYYTNDFIFNKCFKLMEDELIDWHKNYTKIIKIRNKYINKINEENTLKMMEEVKKYTFYKSSN